MRTINAIGCVAVGVLVIAGCALLGGAPVKYSGGVRVTDVGMTLNTFDKDPAGAGKSVCNAKYAAVWPPLKASAEDKPGGDYTIVTRDDGSRQWAYKGNPLYLWIKDQKLGDRTGDGLNKVWHVVKEEPQPMRSGY